MGRSWVSQQAVISDVFTSVSLDAAAAKPGARCPERVSPRPRSATPSLRARVGTRSKAPKSCQVSTQAGGANSTVSRDLPWIPWPP